MMSHRSKQELTDAIRTRYRRAKKIEKQHILDEFVAATGYHRKYAIRIMKQEAFRKRAKKRGRRKIYQGEVIVALEQIWEICGRICSKRLHPFLPEMVRVLERTGDLRISAETKALLLQMSRSTIDRCLVPTRQTHPHGLSTTKPGSLLKKVIPLRTYTPWDEEKPGFLEIDLVAHCGETTEGQYVNTLTCTDISTGWTECLAVFPHSKQAVFEAIQTMRIRLPCPSLCSALTPIMAANLLMTCSSNIANSKRSPSPVPDLTRKMTRPMSSKRIGPLSAVWLAMTASKPKHNACSYTASTKTCASTPTSSSLSSNWSPKSMWTKRSSNAMILPPPLSSVSLTPRKFP